MKDRYERLMMQEEAAMAAQTPKDWGTVVPEISERTQELLDHEGVSYNTNSSVIRLTDELYELDAMICLQSALEDVVGRIGYWEMRKVYDAVFA